MSIVSTDWSSERSRGGGSRLPGSRILSEGEGGEGERGHAREKQETHGVIAFELKLGSSASPLRKSGRTGRRR